MTWVCLAPADSSDSADEATKNGLARSGEHRSGQKSRAPHDFAALTKDVLEVPSTMKRGCLAHPTPPPSRVGEEREVPEAAAAKLGGANRSTNFYIVLLDIK